MSCAMLAPALSPATYARLKSARSFGSGVRPDPLDHGMSVFVAGRDGVLERQPVLDGDDDGSGSGGEGVDVAVVHGGEGGLDAEAATVDVDEEGQFAVGIGGGEVDPGGGAILRRDGDVLGGDAGEGFVGGGNEVVAVVPLDAAGGVDAEEGREVVSEDDWGGVHLPAKLMEREKRIYD
ncbi:alpha/beta-Hydrolases superfamily protein [Striga asiatica]|uniref:Alpha/beta-Hydrolases superfamily protein n=1 Tax=Striga asiatica TaxID=4170 RepID=A0A5A7RHF8_STRAF|nr:alpha/beta-Hydrolases superfamily protein [Striga asiatica]